MTDEHPEATHLKAGDQVWWQDKHGKVHLETVWRVTFDGELIETAQTFSKMRTQGLHRFEWAGDAERHGPRSLRAGDVVWWRDDWGIHIEAIKRLSTDGRLVELELRSSGPPERMAADELRRLEWVPRPTPNCEEDVCPAPTRVIRGEDAQDHTPLGRARAARSLARLTEAHRQEWHRG